MSWKIFVSIGSLVSVVAFLLGLTPIGDGTCGTKLFPVDGSIPTTVGTPLNCFPPDASGYWIAIALGIGLVIVGFILRSNNEEEEVSESEKQTSSISIEEVPNKTIKVKDGTRVKCPYCAEQILAEAIVCKHCGRDVQPQA